jgi:hypothetical protein
MGHARTRSGGDVDFNDALLHDRCDLPSGGESMGVLISEAGVAGPMTAYWLRRYGFNPTIVERTPALGTGGYKIDVRGTALAHGWRS